MNTQESQPSRRWPTLIAILAVAILAITALTYPKWLPLAKGYLSGDTHAGEDDHHAAQDHADGEHGHDEHDEHEGHVESESLSLSPQGLKNAGYEPFTIKLQSFEKTIAIPAIVVELRGRSQIDITAPMTGVVTKVYPIEGVAIEPGQPLFDLRLTHEDLVTAQRDFLRLTEELDVVEQEIERLQSVGDGVIAGKRILEREYEQKKLKAALHAQRQGLLLHGLTNEQLDEIEKRRSLLQTMTIFAPEPPGGRDTSDSTPPYHLQRHYAQTGKQVDAGDRLAVLADHRHLYVEGRAFEEDAQRLNQAAKENWKVSARLQSVSATPDIAENLQILYLADRVDPDSRAFKFYIDLPNEIVRDQVKNGQRFVGWKYKPGQRMEVRLPVERLENRIVLPADAVVEEGAEAFVFERNGEHFDRIPVHIEMRDRDRVVVANDGSLFPGDVVAGAGAYQMHLTMKNKAGGAVDAHAGHNH